MSKKPKLGAMEKLKKKQQETEAMDKYVPCNLLDFLCSDFGMEWQAMYSEHVDF